MRADLLALAALFCCATPAAADRFSLTYDGVGLGFVPLGGVGEIGVNCYLYGQNGRWAMVDLGLGFPDDRLPGVDIVLPDLRFIEEQRAFHDGLILTHAHEDHLGAVPYLWPRLGCPIWCTAFTAAVLLR